MQTWTTREGVKMKVSEMETSHIENCIRILVRAIASRPDEYMYGEPDNDTMALDAFNSEVRHNDQLQEDMENQIKVFKKELRSRYESKDYKE